LTKGDAYIALCKNEKRKCQQNSLNCGIHFGVHKSTHAEQFLPDDTKVHTPIQAMVITYIQPTNEVLEPPIEKDHSNVSKKNVVYNNKLFQLVDNQADGLCLFYFLKDQNIRLGNDSLSVSLHKIRDKKTFLESGIVASLLDYLSKLNETDFGELIQYADFSCEKVDIDMLPPEYHEDIKKIVENFLDEEIKVESLNWIATFISEMINATPDPNCLWPGDVHALILSKLIQTNIVMVDKLFERI
jgi:hypothetical protein